MPHEKRLGEIFVEHGIISTKTRDRVLKRAKILGRRFGSVLEDLELITGEELALALATQHHCKTITHISQLHIDPKLLALISVEAALQHLIFPLKQEGDTLALALVDPTDLQVLSNISINAHVKIVPFVTTKNEIRQAICHHYLGKEVTRSSVRTLLIVDPVRDSCQALQHLLEEDGYRVLTAKDGMEGFKTVIAESPHVVITDIAAPKLNGFGLFGALKNIPETSYIPIIIVSEHEQGEKDELKAFELGIFDMIMKPFTPMTVRARVKRAFHFYDHQYRLY